ncbi:MAG: hypothetical protein KDB68_08150 [Planctomycetes bacterium]|nr:hypothetical protein [Planctomycetota bacterium]
MNTIRQTYSSKFSDVVLTLIAAAPGAVAIGGWLRLIFGGSFEAWLAWESIAILLLLAAFIGRRRLKSYNTEGQEPLYVVSILLSLPAFLAMLVISLLVVYAMMLRL